MPWPSAPVAAPSRRSTRSIRPVRIFIPGEKYGNPEKKPGRPAGTGALVFRDTLYASRTLILADGRELQVVAGAVSTAVGDSLARDYLEQHPDFQLQE